MQTICSMFSIAPDCMPFCVSNAQLILYSYGAGATIDGQFSSQGIQVNRYAGLDLRLINIQNTIALVDEQTSDVKPGCITGGSAINICGGAVVSVFKCDLSFGIVAFENLGQTEVTGDGGLIANAGILTIVDSVLRDSNADF
eukprot:678175-Pleurochrysis_carterae.AAC.1